MVQEFHVLRCFSCETFQVHQVKKSNKWNCKLCGAKQSVRKEYGRGSGADCRRHVQKLNMLRATMDSAPSTCEDTDVSEQDPEWQQDTEDATDPQYNYTDDSQKSSKWEKFVAASDRTDDKDPSDPEDTQFTTDKNTFQQKKRKGKRQGERVALPETLKTKVEESEEVEQLRKEESWNDEETAHKKKVDRQKPRLIGQGQGSLSSSSVSSSRWSKFTSRSADAEDDTDNDDETEHVESCGTNSSYRANDSSKLETSSTQYTGMEDSNVGQRSTGLQGVLGCHGDDPTLQRYNQPMAVPACDPQDEVKTRIMDDVQKDGEVSEIMTAGFCTGEDLDDVLGEDVWDL
uniref:MRN complex-interacting protein N-terminal domain-containing protein n=1 Tax=Branchiostoma floridae TaxID=7739 RepID=C3ZEP2_BRAFL|eukprot:XP_002593187.1 hypothetical protein BRAFLDRAFT_72734 [Branchiostoma floridae]